MKKTSSIFFNCFIIASFFQISCREKKKDQLNVDDYSISTASQDDQTLKDLGMAYPSENASHILDSNQLHIPKVKQMTDTVKGPFIKEFDTDATIVLKSDTPMNGKLVWDVLQSLGLKWGDGDLFHWRNKGNYGDEQFFSVCTATQPGYFLPQVIKAGQMNPDNLVFGFSIPRSADPQRIFTVMINAVKYCQKRLGGKMLDENLKPFNENAAKEELKSLVVKMKNNGINPGSNKAMITY